MIKNIYALGLAIILAAPLEPVLAVDLEKIETSQCGATHPWYLLHQGKTEDARKGYACRVKLWDGKNSQKMLWNALIDEAWFLHQIGESRASIDPINRALEVAVRLKDNWREGRTLSWLAWGYADIGLYQLADKFYRRAIELGAPQGKITYIDVWGMSTQELGYLMLRRGNLEKARELITTTLNFAREHGVDVGVAEGAAHLAEVAYSEGKLSEAGKLAEEGIDASYRCNCSPLNTARALTMAARVAYELSKSDVSAKEKAKEATNRAIKFSEGKDIRRYLAESKIISSYFYPPQDYEHRYPLVSAAVDLLSKVENEQRGVAELELGKVLLDSDRRDLAERYINYGLALNEELFRTLDASYARAQLSELRLLQGDISTRVSVLQKGAEDALAAGALPRAYENEEALSKELQALGYLSLARSATERGLQCVDQLLGISNDKSVKEMWYARKLMLTERRAEIELALAALRGPAKESA